MPLTLSVPGIVVNYTLPPCCTGSANGIVMAMKKLLAVILFTSLCIFPRPAHALTADPYAGTEHIQTMAVDATLTKQNLLNVHESIDYDFGSGAKHGIYRDIPTAYHQGADTYYTNVKLGTVTQDGATAKTSVSKADDNLDVRIGDADRTISGLHSYTINYTIQPLAYKLDSQPFLNVDLIGTGWIVPIATADITLRLEDNAQLTNITCFRGAYGATTGCSTTPTAANTLHFTETNLSSGNGVTINANLPSNYTSTYLVANKKPPLTLGAVLTALFHAAVPIFFGILILGAIIIAMLRSLLAKKKRRRQTVIPEYEPPATLTPAEIGHLEDDSSGMAEVTATLIQLAVQGYIAIIQSEKTGLGRISGKYEYTLRVIKPFTNADPAAAALAMGIIGPANEVTLSKVDRTSAAVAVQSFKSATLDALTSKGYYAQHGGLLTNGAITDAGAQEWAHVDGFKLYLSTVEKDRLNFTDAPERTPERFNQLLPYAIALGVEKEWAKQFKDIDIRMATNWYYGNSFDAFAIGAMAGSLNSSFASATSPSGGTGGGFSAGGGFSGGGGGGGGGGSW